MFWSHVFGLSYMSVSFLHFDEYYYSSYVPVVQHWLAITKSRSHFQPRHLLSVLQAAHRLLVFYMSVL